MTPTHGVQDRVQRKLDRFDEILSSEEAQAQVTVLPLITIHEARYAYQQLREKYGSSDPELFDILEPFSRAIGWVEALSYSLGVKSQSEKMQNVLREAMIAGRTEIREDSER